MRDSPNVMVREAVASDAPAIRELLNSNALSDEAVGSLEIAHTVAVDGREIVGVAALERHGDVGLLRSVAVAPAWRRKGIASALVHAITRKFDDCSAVYLFTDTAERLFARLGFEVVPRHALPTEIANTSQALVTCPASAKAMRRVLSQQRQARAR